jgi:hypothetical protein
MSHFLCLLKSRPWTLCRAASKRFIAALQRTAQLQQKDSFSASELRQVAAASGAKVGSFPEFLVAIL